MNWRRHAWRTASGELGHRDLWEQILWERAGGGTSLVTVDTVLHLGVPGNHGADALAEEGRQQCPNNDQALPKRHQPQQWDELGLEELSLAEEAVGI